MKKFYKIPVIYLAIFMAFALCAWQAKTFIARVIDPVYENRDTTISPGTDFFLYANGGWFKRNPIPPAYSSWGIDNLVTEGIRLQLKKINEDALKANAAKGTNTQKIGDFYYTGLDSAGIEKAGIAPLKVQLDFIGNAKNSQDILNAAAILTTTGTRNILGIRVSQDDKNSSKMMVQMGQAGLGLPNRDYYFKTDPRTTKIRNDYNEKYLPTLLKLSGWDEAKALAGAKATYTIEKFLADSSRKLENLRDPYRNYNKMTVAALNKLTPGIDWTTLFKTLQYKAVDTVIVGQPEYYRACEHRFENVFS